MLVRAVVGSMRVLLADSGGTEVTSVQGYVIIFTGALSPMLGRGRRR